MKSLWNNPVLSVLSSLKTGAILLAIVAVAAGKATFIENDYGRDGAYSVIYAARWFEILLGLITLNLILNFFRRWPYEPRKIGFMLVHISVVVILIGAAMTRYLGYEGIMPIREGQTTDFIYSDKAHAQATLGQETASFPVRLFEAGAVDTWQNVTLGGRAYTLGVTEYWPHFAEVYRPGEGGVPGLRYGTTRDGEVVQEMLLQGDRAEIGQVSVRYREDGLTERALTSRFGEVRARIAGEVCRFPVTPPDGTIHTCGGHKLEITELQTDFRVGGESNIDGPLVNPMIRLEITAPDGATGERILFALHPDFSMGHSGAGEDFGDLDLLYEVNLGLELAAQGETLQARATFPLETIDMNSEQRDTIAAGEVFTIGEQVLYVSDANDFSFIPVEVMPSVVLGPGHSDSANAPSAARVVIRDQQGDQAEAVCVRQAAGQRVELGDQTLTLAYGPVVKKLPYSLTLDDFVLDTYPGSDNPATYESYVTLHDPEQGISGRQVHIYMNHPLTHRGTKHFQSSYDPDRRGTVLSVNHDPGKWPTYVGYMLITLGFVLIMLQDVIWPKAKRRAEKRGEALSRAALVVLAGVLAGGLLIGSASPARAQNDGSSDDIDHSGHAHAQPVKSGFVTLSDPAREAASRLIIQDYRGRMKPLDTLAREMVMKVAKKTKFQGRQPVDMYLNWAFNANTWWDEPCIAVRHGGLKDLLGVSPETKHVSPASLFSSGNYDLTQLVGEAHRTPDRERTKTQRKLISFDERFNLLYMTFRGTTLRLFPVPGDQNNTWLDINEVLDQLSPGQQTAYRSAYTDLADGMRTGDNMKILSGINQIADLQQIHGAQVIPSDVRLAAELTYNRSHLFSWMMVPLLVAWGVLMLLYLWNLFRNHGRRLSFRNPVYSLGVTVYVLAFAGMIVAYVLRWVASGRAPLSNGHESLLFISLAVALAGLIFELVYRQAAPAGLAALLTVVILGVSMLSVFDPAIGPLVPVLVSYWLNIHVTVITASYGFLGLSALIGALILLLLLGKGPGKAHLHEAIGTLDSINKQVMITGLGLLTVGTLLGGVWANESWGRYWGWDPKETWSLVTILVYAVVLHFRYIPALRSIWLNSAGALAAVGSVVMTYFGVNYFLSGLHSYAQGDAAQVPAWVYIFTVVVLALIAVSGLVNRARKWEAAG